MSETNDSGNRWEKPAENEDGSTSSAETPAAADPIEEPPAPAAAEAADPDAVPAPAPEAPAAARSSRLPSWVTARGVATVGAAAAIFIGGGGIGYAIGANHDDGSRPGPGRFDRTGFNGQFPGNGQAPGGGQGQNFGGPNFQGPQGQPQGQSQSQSQGQSQSQSQGGTSS